MPLAPRLRQRKAFVSAAVLPGAVAALALGICTPRVAAAQKKEESKALHLTHATPWGRAAAEGRARMAAGDCKAAVAAFDDALRAAGGVDVRRDRGLCHEKLDNPFAAAEDFRAYLYERPEAHDAEEIRERLGNLQERALDIERQQKKQQLKEHPPQEETVQTIAGGRQGTSVYMQGRGDPGTEKPPPPDETGTLDSVKEKERREQEAEDSALRRGTGAIIGAHFDVRAWGESTMGVGLIPSFDLRWAFSKTSTLQFELGYSNAQGPSVGSSNAMGGALVYIGYEARFALDPRATNAIYLGVGPGYEHLASRQTGRTYAGIMPRARLGYRLVLGPNLGIELGVDGGPAFLILYNPPATATKSGDITTFFIGGHIGVMASF